MNSADNPLQGPGWELDSEYNSCDAPELLSDLQRLDVLLSQIGALNSELVGDERVLAAQKIYALSVDARKFLGNVGTYVNCLLSVDSRHDGALKLQGRLQNVGKRYGDLLEPHAEFIETVEEVRLAEYLADPIVAPSEFIVRHQRKHRHQRLSLPEESLVNGLSQDGIHAWGKLYTQLSGTIECNVLVGNEQQKMGIAQASGLLTSTDERQRENAWRGMNEAWETHEEACAASLNAIAGWRLEMVNKRSHSKAVHFLDSPTHVNRIERATLDTLMEVATAARPLAQKAVKLQARAYRKPTLGPWDMRAPAPVLEGGARSDPIGFDAAVDLIASAYGEVDASMEAFVRMMVEKRWVEGTVGPRKRPGAYCTGFAKSRHPRVYMTYTGGASDVITLAHELGHAYHSWVMRDLPDSQLGYGMSLAETASTFGETLVRDALLKRAQSPAAKLDMAWEEMAAFTAFILNIPARYEFEKRVYEMREERPLTTPELKQLMRQAWRNWYGDALSEPDVLFWANKLHFHISGLSFYNFPYLFGYLFSLGVYAKRAEFGSAFFDRYRSLLRDTGRMSAEDVAQRHLGVDLTHHDFWQQTIDSLAPRVDAFGTLLGELEIAV